MRRPLLFAAVAAVLHPATARAQRLEALFAPKARVWERWTRHDDAATTRVDHAAWDGILQRILRRAADGSARIAYGAVGRADRQALEAYLAALAATPASTLSRAEQFAFWVNLYNALTIRLVLDAYPVASIRDINLSGGVFVRGPWDAKLVPVEGELVSLGDIEHRILRPIWRDPRVHYAVNCASIGCPDLPPRAFTAANTAALLDAGARAYANSPRGVALVADGLRLSSIYNWFADDFAGEGGVVPHLRRFATPTLLQALQGTPRIEGYAYDWALNDAR